MVAESPVIQRIVDLLSDAPAPDRIMRIGLTPEEANRYEELAELNAEGKLTTKDQEELDAFLFADSLVGMAKAKAFGKLNNRNYA